MCKFSNWEGKRVYPDIFNAFFNNNFTHIFKSGGVFTPSYPPLAPPLVVFFAAKAESMHRKLCARLYEDNIQLL